MERLKSKVALVTGGASGLGKVIAQRLAAEGAKVVITDIQAALGAETAAQFDFTFLEQDVTNEAQWSDVIGRIQRTHGCLHVVVNNAGILGSRERVNPQETSLAEWKRIFSVNVEGVFLGCRASIPAMQASGGGSIINMSSVAGLLATPYATAYGASKAAVMQLTKSIAQHCAEMKLRIRCNSVHPGIVRTPLWDAQAAEGARKRGVSIETVVRESERAIPLGDFTLPDDVAAAVAFLASDESRHVTGSRMVIDGGLVHCDTYHMLAASRK